MNQTTNCIREKQSKTNVFFLQGFVAQKKMNSVEIATLLAITLTSAAAWNNVWDGSVNFQCPSNQVIYRMRSTHSNIKEDRLHAYYCRAIGSYGNSDCYWSYWTNDWDRPVDFQCPYGGVITGVHSVHDNEKEDRR